jgi:hypothetical protein
MEALAVVTLQRVVALAEMDDGEDVASEDSLPKKVDVLIRRLVKADILALEKDEEEDEDGKEGDAEAVDLTGEPSDDDLFGRPSRRTRSTCRGTTLTRRRATGWSLVWIGPCAARWCAKRLVSFLSFLEEWRSAS